MTIYVYGCAMVGKEGRNTTQESGRRRKIIQGPTSVRRHRCFIRFVTIQSLIDEPSDTHYNNRNEHSTAEYIASKANSDADEKVLQAPF
jgi:hypothetical protein